MFGFIGLVFLGNVAEEIAYISADGFIIFFGEVPAEFLVEGFQFAEAAGVIDFRIDFFEVFFVGLLGSANLFGEAKRGIRPRRVRGQCLCIRRIHRQRRQT